MSIQADRAKEEGGGGAAQPICLLEDAGLFFLPACNR